MKIVTIQIELGIENMESEIDFSNKDNIADFLNRMMYEDPEFYGELGPENILQIVDAD